MFPKHCDEQVRFEFKRPVLNGLVESSSGSYYYQNKVPEQTQILAYSGWLTDTIEFGKKNRRFSYCVFNELRDTLQVFVENEKLLALFDSNSQSELTYFAAYIYNPGPDRFTNQYLRAITEYQVKTQLGWMTIDRVIDNNLGRCGNDYRYYDSMLPGEVQVHLFAKRDGPDLVESRICISNNCSEKFYSKVDLHALLPIQSSDFIEAKD